MRIACVHIPQFALQCATRIDPSLRLRSEHQVPVVIVGPAPLADPRAPAPRSARASSTASALHSPIVLACSRAAWSLGARVGMTATSARALSPALHVVMADAELERDTVRAIADTLLAVSPTVDVGGRLGPGGAHLAVYCEVPTKTRGATFGDRLLERIAALGITARVGIADDRFTAWVAASSPPTAPNARTRRLHDAAGRVPDAASFSSAGSASADAAEHSTHHQDDPGVVSVPRGGSAAFLAPRPLSLLSITPEVQHMLEALGVSTLGEFASLPPPTVSPRGSRLLEADFQALARGESGVSLRPYAPDAPIREEAVIHADHDAIGGLSTPAAVALLAERIALRLLGRGRCAARLDVTITRGLGSPGAPGSSAHANTSANASASTSATEGASAAVAERTVTLSPVRDTAGVLASAEALAEAIGTAVGDSTGYEEWRLRVVVTGEALAGDAVAGDVLAGDTLAGHALAGTTHAGTPVDTMLTVASSASARSATSRRTAGAQRGADLAGGPRDAGTSFPAAAVDGDGADPSGARQEHTAPRALPEGLAAGARFAAGARMPVADRPVLPAQRTFAALAGASTPRPAIPTSAAASATRASTAPPSIPANDHASRTPSSIAKAGSNDALTGTPRAHPGEVDTLAVVLSTTGGSVDRIFGLTSPVSSAVTSERREALAHRRTRRGKQRRRVHAGVAAVQARLFKS